MTVVLWTQFNNRFCPIYKFFKIDAKQMCFAAATLRVIRTYSYCEMSIAWSQFSHYVFAQIQLKQIPFSTLPFFH